jgi:hypothetical protein
MCNVFQRELATTPAQYRRQFRALKETIAVHRGGMGLCLFREWDGFFPRDEKRGERHLLETPLSPTRS